MDIYFSSPSTQTHAAALKGRRVLLSYAMRQKVVYRDHVPTFRRVLLDSGAWSAFTTGKKVELAAYIDWALPLLGLPHVVAAAGLDDLSGDWRQSLRNYQAFPRGFPTFHVSDPAGLLDDLLAICRERKLWLGLGMCGRQQSIDRDKERWLRDALGRIPGDVHVHGWALTRYAHVGGMHSTDTTRWLWLAQSIQAHHHTSQLTTAEAIGVAVKQILRLPRGLKGREKAGLRLAEELYDE